VLTAGSTVCDIEEKISVSDIFYEPADAQIGLKKDICTKST
jgi:hypothetical protein